MKVLVTGGAGFAGLHLVEYLLDQGLNVVATVQEGKTLPNLSHASSRLHLEHVDIRDRERIQRILHDTQPQRIYHLAALTSPSDSFDNPSLTYEVNFTGTLNLLLACRQLDADCRLLFVSTSEVYGNVRQEDLPLREDTPLRPSNPYAGSKAAGELLAYQFFKSYGLRVIRVRPFNHTGPRQSSTFVCSNFARQFAEIDLGLRPPQVTVGNLKILRDFSDVRDIVRGYFLLLEKGDPGEVYHLGAGCAVSIEEILRTLICTSSKRIEVNVDKSRVRTQEAAAIWGDISKTMRTIDWKPERALESTLRDLRSYWDHRLRSS